MIKDISAYVEHVLGAIAKIRRIQASGSIVDNDILYDATLRNLQTLSEATQRLPAAIKSQYPDVPWQAIYAFRNVLVHNYLGDIDPLTVGRVLDVELVLLERAMKSILSGLNP